MSIEDSLAQIQASLAALTPAAIAQAVVAALPSVPTDPAVLAAVADLKTTVTGDDAAIQSAVAGVQATLGAAPTP